MSDTNRAVQTLNHISDAMSAVDSSAVAAVRIEDPVNAIESSLTDFVKDSFSQVQKDRDFKETIKEAIVARLSEFNAVQLANLYKDVQSGEIGATSVLVGPLAQIESARVAAEIETHQLPGTQSFLDEKVFKKAGKDVLQGIVQLNQILEAMNTAKNSPIVDVTPEKKA